MHAIFKIRFHFVFIILIPLFLGSCKKKDKSYPEITITSPAENSAFNVFDTVLIKGFATDNENLEYVSIRLVQEGNVPALPTKTLYPETNSYNIFKAYPLDDFHLKTGEYYFRIEASDGENQMSEYRKTRINGITTELDGVVIIANTGNEIEAFVLDENMDFIHLQSFSGEYKGSVLSSLYRYFNVANQNEVSSYHFEDSVIQWTASHTFPLRHISFYNEITYACFENGSIRGYNENGSQVFGASSQREIYKVFGCGNYVWAQERVNGAQNNHLAGYYLSTGDLITDGLQNNYDIVNMLTMEEKRFFIFANEGEQGVMELLELSNDGPYTWEPHEVPSGRINDAIQVSADEYLIAHENEIFLYRYSDNSLTTLYNEPGVENLVYDEVNNRVIASRGNELFFLNYSLSSAGLSAKVTYDHPILGVHVLNNK